MIHVRHPEHGSGVIRGIKAVSGRAPWDTGPSHLVYIAWTQGKVTVESWHDLDESFTVEDTVSLMRLVTLLGT